MSVSWTVSCVLLWSTLWVAMKFCTFMALPLATPWGGHLKFLGKSRQQDEHHYEHLNTMY